MAQTQLHHDGWSASTVSIQNNNETACIYLRELYIIVDLHVARAYELLN